MGLALKLYQERCLEVLAEYLTRAGQIGAKAAFDERPELDFKYREVPQLPGLPYVCVRVPTGGGKTLLAAHSVGVAAREFLQIEHCVVLWMAPTNAIVDQTFRALRDRRHPYRQALDADFGGAVEVLSLPEALYVSRATLDSATTVIVSTLAAMRVEETEGRKVYETSGALQHHFSGLSEKQLALLDKTPEGVYSYSLGNVLKLRRPLVILDEAHNARTPLSFDTLKRFAPSCIIEFTATPDQETNPSNVLYSASAAELKFEQMVKLPIRLLSRPNWKEAVADAVARQRQLERLAKEEEKATGEYVRPLVLLQAQPKSEREETITVEALRQCLLTDFKIPPEEIVEGTGQRWEVPENLLTRDSPVRFVLTVQALREGWDCPFAYILCSVSNLTSRRAVEQILGRVLRLPYARTKQHAELNLAYAFATSAGFVEAAESLADALVESGFTRFEAKSFVEPDPSLFDPAVHGGLFAEAVTVTEEVTTVPALDQLPASLRSKVSIAPPALGSPLAKLTYTGGGLAREEAAALASVFTKAEDKDAVERLTRKSWGLPAHPAALGLPFAVPHLAVRVGTQLEIFEDQFQEVPVDLAACEARVTEVEFSLDASAGGADVDVDQKGQIQINPLEELREQLSLLDLRGPNTESELVDWLDRSFEHHRITQPQSCAFLRRLVDRLIHERGVTLADLVSARFRLRDAARAKINQHQMRAWRQNYQRMLLPDFPTPLTVSPELCFQFPFDQYPANRVYPGPLKFPKHFYETPGEMNSEEAVCAAELEALPEVKYWVRNLTRPDFSFWLQTATDKFYPDFVALLTDGRYLVVEYKGAGYLDSPDTLEKKALGEIWAARSEGRCIFCLVGMQEMRQTLRAAVVRP